MEKKLVELISPYRLAADSVGEKIGGRWSAPLNFASSPHRRLMIAMFHCGASAPGLDLWAVHETKEGALLFAFEGHTKGCGNWQVLSDLDADSYPEIIVKHFIGQYEGAGTIAVWPAIYKWDGENYLRADENFSDYYAKHVVPEYQETLSQHSDWENHEDETVRQIYRKCEFVLNKALSISNRSKPKP